MKFLVLLVLVAAWANAEQIKPVRLEPPRGSFLKRPHSGINSRITGGHEATPHSIPYQVGLFIHSSDGTNFCGGSLISARSVLTAAHCGEISNDVDVILGAHRIQDANETTQQDIKAGSILVHEGWDRLNLLNDISIITLAVDVVFDDYIQPVVLPPRSLEGNALVGEVVRASGWGLDSDAATTISPVLREVSSTVATNLICSIYYLGAVADTHICISGDEGRSTCSGDSGGPLVLFNSGQQVGIVSFGIALGCEIGWPPVFTRVTSFLEWIEINSDVTIAN